jgi:putative N6-adenine-specific DNA methylase
MLKKESIKGNWSLTNLFFCTKLTNPYRMHPETSSKSPLLQITLKCFFGFETILAEELNELGYADVKLLNRAVQINGTWQDVYKLNLYSRCAIAVLVEIDHFFIQSEEDLYKRALRIKWHEIFDVNKTFAVKGAVYSHIFKNTHYPYLLVKDAIVDTFNKHFNDRPNIDVKKPNVLFDLYIKEKEVTISVNTSGLPLFQRGYRSAVGPAPLNEVVAACLIRMSGWDKKQTLIDPFCGSGTLLIEAALLASGIPSNIERQHYAFKNLKNYDASSWESLFENAPRVVRQLPCQILGGDISDEMVLKARRNLRNFSFGRFVNISSTSFDQLKVEPPVFIITNPPYDHRLSADVEELYGQIGSWLKHKMAPSTACIISSSEEGFNAIGLKASLKRQVFNGDLDCEYRKYELFEGKKALH